MLALADKGYAQAMRDDANLLNGLNVHLGAITCAGVAETLGYPLVEPLEAIAA
jgi:alanine dehydrogenase